MPLSASREGLQRQQTRRIASHASDPSRVSFTGSIAAGLHETLNLLWRPLDPDHPEDVFLRRSRHGNVARTGVEAEEGYGGGYGDEYGGGYGGGYGGRYGGGYGGGYDAYGVDDDMPIRAVYGSVGGDRRGGGRHRGEDTSDDAMFAPLGMGLGNR
jgi:hypothetical protein